MLKESKFWDETILIDSFPKNKRSKIEIKHSVRNSINYVDIREMVLSTSSDEYIHTNKGICLTFDMYKKITDEVSEYIKGIDNNSTSDT